MSRSSLRIAIALAVVLASGCAPQATRQQIEDQIASFLVAVRNRSDSFGWDQLRGDVRESYPGGRAAWIATVSARDTSRLDWTITVDSVDDNVGCARVAFGSSLDAVPDAFFRSDLPAAARIASPINDGSFAICATVGPTPAGGGVHGVG